MKNSLLKKAIISLVFIMVFCFSMSTFIACNKDNDTGNTPTPPPPGGEETLVELETYSAQIETGATYQIQVLNAEGEVVFTSRNTQVATVSNTGLVTGIGDGQTIIDVVNGDDELEFAVTVTEAAIAGVNFKLNAVSSQIYVGYKLTLNPKITIGEEVLDNANYTINYDSSNDAVVEVSANGVVLGKSVGSAIITATVEIEGETYTQSVEITVIELATVALDKTDVVLSKTGDFNQTTLTYEYKKYQNGAFVPATGSDAVWSSSDDNVVTVNDGVLTGVGAGTATISVEVGNANATCEVTVHNYYAKIYDAQGFLDINNHLDGYFELTNDIDFSNTEFANPIGYIKKDNTSAKITDYHKEGKANPFTGYLNGNGYTVRNITHAVGSGDERFERLIIAKVGKGAIVENIGFEITNGNSTIICGGGVTGANMGTIRNVFVDLTISGIGTAYNEWGTAGIANLNFGLISSCVANIKTSASVVYGGVVCLGGIVNTNKGAQIESCLAVVNAQDVLVCSHTGSWGTVSGCAVVTSVADISGSFNKALLSSSIWNTTGETLPVLKNAKETVIEENKIFVGPNGEKGVNLDLDGEVVISAMIDGKEVAHTMESNNLVIAPAQFADIEKEQVTLIIETGEFIYLYTLSLTNNEIIKDLAITYDKSTAQGASFSVSDIAEQITKVEVMGVETTFNVDGSKNLVIPHATFVDLSNKCEVKVYTESTIYVYTVTVYSAIFSGTIDAATFKSTIEADMNGYYLLSGNVVIGRFLNPIGLISYPPESEAPKATNSTFNYFTGTIDGQGYSISYSYQWGGGNQNRRDKYLIYAIGETGVIKNLSILVRDDEIDSSEDTTHRRAGFACLNYGTFDNCFIQYEMMNGGANTQMSYGKAVVTLSNYGTISNCVVSLKNHGTNTGLGFCSSNHGTIVDSVFYYSGAGKTEHWNNSDGGAVRTAVTTTSITDAIAAVNGEKFTKGTLWTTDTNAIYFNGVKVIG